MKQERKVTIEFVEDTNNERQNHFAVKFINLIREMERVTKEKEDAI